MGEAANKMSRSERQRRIYQLRDEIAHKRQELSAEVEELRRRREQAMILGRKVAKLGAFAAATTLAVGSVVNAVVDVMRPEQAQQPEQKQVEPHHRSEPSIRATIFAIALAALRIAAMRYMKTKIGQLQTRTETPQNSLHA